MKEASKSIMRRLHDSRFATRYFVGEGIDIGAGLDPISLYGEFFPLMAPMRLWEVDDGDAQIMDGVGDQSFDFVHSSHCLEHLLDPKEGLINWFRILKDGGHMIITVPDEDMYEQGIFPSRHNEDHKWTFTIYKASSWSKASINLIDLVKDLGAKCEIVKIERLDATYRQNLPRMDQTITPVGECGIELVIRKRPSIELAKGGQIPLPQDADAELVRILSGFPEDKV